MPNLFQRFSKGFQAGLKAARSAAPDLASVSAALDAGIQAGVVPVFGEDVMKSLDSKSQLDIRKMDHDVAYAGLLQGLRTFSSRSAAIPEYGSAGEDELYAKIWRTEPILAGAIYSMSAKMTAMSWKVTGKRLNALNIARIFANAAFMDGRSWDGFLASTTQDFYTTNRGVFWETPKAGNAEYGKLMDIGHIDALACELTGNVEKPMRYISEVSGQDLKFNPGEYLHFTSMASPREVNLGIGFCAVARAYRAAKLLIGLHDYDSEKLNNLPPEGVATVSGLTMDEFKDAISLWQAHRRSDNSLTFPQVLWLIGSQPNTEVKVGFQGFSQLPESFDRVDVINQYINTLAMCFGVDAREFWAISSGSLGTASESEIQHLKAKGKGSGEFITITERRLNSLLPEDADFGYDTQDIEEDATAATTAKLWIDAYLPLVTTSVDKDGNVISAQKPADHLTSNMAEDRNKEKVDPTKNGMPGKSANYTGTGDRAGGLNTPVVVKGEPILSVKDFLRLLADKGVLPDYLVKDTRVAIQDSVIHTKERNQEDDACFEWRNGILKEVRLPAIVINTNLAVAEIDSEDSNVDKEGEAEEPALKIKRGIKGTPIADEEVQRGAAVNKNTVKAEMEIWQEVPELADHALTEDEIKALNLKG
jgi:hypothetical protein